MAGDLGKALDMLDLVVAKAWSLTGDDRLEPYARVARQARTRMGYLGETVVLALAGGTGAGKSSLLNAIAGASVAPVGRIRPTTDRPLVWLPSEPEPGLLRLLDDLGVEERIEHTAALNLAIVDLPDFDSISLEHRATVERLIPRVDAVLWVLDPEKYGDRSLHETYLRPLSGYREQFVFALNQIDRLAPGELDLVRDDLIALLEADGITGPVVFDTAADPVAGRPIGIERLVAFVEDTLEVKRTVIGKLVEDIRRAGRGVADVTGVQPGSGLDFDRRWARTRAAVVAGLGDLLVGREVTEAAEDAGRLLAVRSGSGPLGRAVAGLRRSLVGRPLETAAEDEAIGGERHRRQDRTGLGEAVEAVASTVTELSFESGGGFGAELRERFGPATVETELQEATEGVLAASRDRPVPAKVGWWRLAAAAQWLIVITVVSAFVWAWAGPEALRRDAWPWPIILGVGALIAGVVLARIVRWSGRRAGRRAAGVYRVAIERRLAARVDQRIGTPLRTVMRDRAELGGALAELGVELARLESVLPQVPIRIKPDASNADPGS
ncbi:MAG: hypothetical protein GXP34_11225 [Actinobacteria bacterium]|nr:hypothetical protein [Actinomycetota bacterium]